jgi:hypothetical protein
MKQSAFAVSADMSVLKSLRGRRKILKAVAKAQAESVVRWGLRYTVEDMHPLTSTSADQTRPDQPSLPALPEPTLYMAPGATALADDGPGLPKSLEDPSMDSSRQRRTQQRRTAVTLGGYVGQADTLDKRVTDVNVEDYRPKQVGLSLPSFPLPSPPILYSQPTQFNSTSTTGFVSSK